MTNQMYVNIGGKNLFVKHHSSFPGQPTLVFLHDSLGCTALWRDFPDRLADALQCNVLVYDRLGYGQSDAMDTFERPVNYLELQADVLSELLAKLKLVNVILFGHSDGGSIALITAAKYPEKITAVVCEAAHIFVEAVTLNGIYEAMDAYQHTDLPQRLQKYHGDKVEMLYKAWTQTWTRPDFRQWSIEYLLPQISCPLLFIQGAADEYGSLQQVEKTIGQVSGPAQKYLIPDVGHTPHKEAPGLTLQAAQLFIAEVLLNRAG